MFIVVVEFSIKPESIAAFVERVKHQARDSLGLETDCHRFDVSIANDDPQLVLLYEEYSDKQAFDAHLQSAHFNDFSQTVTPWVSNRRLTTYQRVE